MIQQNLFKARAFLTTALIALFAVAAFTVSADAAMRCRDCPFPMKIGDNRWLMPESSVVVEIFEQRLPDMSYQMSVSLKDANTGELLAAGSTHRTKLQRSVTITLIDPQGREVSGEIKWVNFTTGMIQARFSCLHDSCSIQRRL